MGTYKNSFYSPQIQGSTNVIETDIKPVEYKGYFIYERIRSICFDVVKDGVCIGMYAGINGAKQFIDIL